MSSISVSMKTIPRGLNGKPIDVIKALQAIAYINSCLRCRPNMYWLNDMLKATSLVRAKYSTYHTQEPRCQNITRK